MGVPVPALSYLLPKVNTHSLAALFSLKIAQGGGVRDGCVTSMHPCSFITSSATLDNSGHSSNAAGPILQRLSRATRGAVQSRKTDHGLGLDRVICCFVMRNPL